MSHFHVETPDIKPPEPGEGAWGAIGRLAGLVGLLAVVVWAWKGLK